MPDARNFYADMFHLPLSKREKTVAEIMFAVPIDTNYIAAYLGDVSPNHARVFVSKLRRKLKGTGWTISTNSGGHGKPGTYRLEREA